MYEYRTHPTYNTDVIITNNTTKGKNDSNIYK